MQIKDMYICKLRMLVHKRVPQGNFCEDDFQVWDIYLNYRENCFKNVLFFPLHTGIGWGMLIISSFTCIYYNVPIAWCFYYLFSSFTKEIPWATCDNEWNTPGKMKIYDTSTKDVSSKFVIKLRYKLSLPYSNYTPEQ